MSRTLPEQDEYTPSITVPEDGEEFNAAANDLALGGINNRVVNLRGRMQTVESWHPQILSNSSTSAANTVRSTSNEQRIIVLEEAVVRPYAVIQLKGSAAPTDHTTRQFDYELLHSSGMYINKTATSDLRREGLLLTADSPYGLYQVACTFKCPSTVGSRLFNIRYYNGGNWQDGGRTFKMGESVDDTFTLNAYLNFDNYGSGMMLGIHSTETDAITIDESGLGESIMTVTYMGPA